MDIFEKITKENKTLLALENKAHSKGYFRLKQRSFGNSVLLYILFIHHLFLIGAGREFGQKFNVKSGFRTKDSGALLGDIPIFVCNYLSYQLRGGKSL